MKTILMALVLVVMAGCVSVKKADCGCDHGKQAAAADTKDAAKPCGAGCKCAH